MSSAPDVIARPNIPECVLHVWRPWEIVSRTLWHPYNLLCRPCWSSLQACGWQLQRMTPSEVQRCGPPEDLTQSVGSECLNSLYMRHNYKGQLCALLRFMI